MKIHRNNVAEFFTGSINFMAQERFKTIVEALGLNCPCNKESIYSAMATVSLRKSSYADRHNTTMELYVGLDCIKYLLSNVQIMTMYRDLRLGNNIKEFRNYYLLAEHFTTDPDEFPW